MRYFLELCLQSVEAALKDIHSEIIVVDNYSSDGSCAMVKARFPHVKLIENKENYGFAKGNNMGVAEAKGEYICILNPDTVVAEDTFKTILKFADSKSNLGIVGCQLMDGKGYFLPESKRNIPTPKVAFEKLIGNTTHYYANHVSPEDIGEVDVLVGAFMILKRSVYDSIKGFDERYFMYGEDIDLSYAIKKEGFTNYYFGQTTVLHFKGESTLKDKKYLKRFYGAMILFYKKNFSKGSVFNFFVKLGITIFSSFNKPKPLPFEPPKRFFSISELPKELISQFSMTYKKIDEHFIIPEDSRVVLNANTSTFYQIIQVMKSNGGKQGVTFRIWPKSSNFIVGSDSNTSNGEVVHF